MSAAVSPKVFIYTVSANCIVFPIVFSSYNLTMDGLITFSIYYFEEDFKELRKLLLLRNLGARVIVREGLKQALDLL